jgi:hypothetical protein
MSTAQKTLIDAIRRIALDSEALASALGDLQKRGVIDGIKTTLGGYNELQDDCCTEGDGNPDNPTEEKDPIDEDAPPEVPDIGDEDGDGESEWSDCETGEPITFGPGGFPQPETCKECERPDPDWKPGTYWIRLSYSQASATPVDVYRNMFPWRQTDYTVYFESGRVGERWSEDSVQVLYTLKFVYDDGTIGYDDFQDSAKRRYCSNVYVAGVCELTEPPLITDDCIDWEPDNTTNYTLANGCITASSCDPESSAQAQQCNECITVCNDSGEERSICAIGNGQWILYDPAGKYKGGRYDATGRRLEILPAGETGGYLPSESYDGSYDGGTIGGGDGWVWS